MTQSPIPYFVQVSAPSSEPLTLAEVKHYLRIDSTEEDSVLNRIIVAARQIAERYLRRSLVTQSWMLSYDSYAPEHILLPRGPVQSVTSVKIVARDGTETVIAATKYYLNAGKEKLVLDFIPIGHVIEVEYVAGYGEAASVPAELKQGMLAHIADLYEMRSTEAALTADSLALYAPYRRVLL